MGKDSIFEQQREQVRTSYIRRKTEQAKVWLGFDDEVKDLANMVGKEFQKLLNEMGPIDPKSDYVPEARTEVLDYEVSYDSELDNFWITLIKARTTEGIILGEGEGMWECPHVYLAPLIGFRTGQDPRVVKFREKYSVALIKAPLNLCDHK